MSPSDYSLLPSRCSLQLDTGEGQGEPVAYSQVAHTDSDNSDPGPPFTRISLSAWVFAFALITTIVNLGCTTYLLLHRVSEYSASANIPLRRPSVYIGLESLSKNESWRNLARARINYPDAIVTISDGEVSERSQKARPNVNITASASSSMMQFQVRDFGLETCSIKGFFPAAKDLGSKSYSIEGPGDRATFDMWALDSSLELLQQSHISNNKRAVSSKMPGRRSYIGTVTVHEGSIIESPSFHCQGRSILLIEVTCAQTETDSCKLAFNQEHDLPKLGFYLRQIGDGYGTGEK